MEASNTEEEPTHHSKNKEVNIDVGAPSRFANTLLGYVSSRRKSAALEEGNFEA